MNTDQLIAKLDELIAATRSAAIPANMRWLSAESMAAMLDMSPRQFAERMELMEAILFAAGGDEARAVSIWENGPSDAELVCIIERVTKNGLYATTDFVWGAAGSGWAGEANE